jgi:hypothetical protein
MYVKNEVSCWSVLHPVGTKKTFYISVMLQVIEFTITNSSKLKLKWTEFLISQQFPQNRIKVQTKISWLKTHAIKSLHNKIYIPANSGQVSIYGKKIC